MGEIKVNTCNGCRFRNDFQERVCDECFDFNQYQMLVTTPRHEGIKYDTGKPRIGEMIKDFAIPLLEVCKVWEFGANKYAKSNWKKVENGEDRYTNAMIRHLLVEDTEGNDVEMQIEHYAAVAWNALARIKFLKEGENDEEKL